MYCWVCAFSGLILGSFDVFSGDLSSCHFCVLFFQILVFSSQRSCFGVVILSFPFGALVMLGALSHVVLPRWCSFCRPLLDGLGEFSEAHGKMNPLE